MQEAIVGLLSEVHPNTVMGRTRKTYTAADLISELKTGSEVGQQWASGLLRVCRDILQQSVQKAERQP